MVASWAIPTACVFVIVIGHATVPDSSTHDTPVISPLPFSQNTPAAQGSALRSRPRARIAVTPVRTLSASISVRYPTSTPGTSVIAFHSPGVPANGTPSERARGFPAGVWRWLVTAGSDRIASGPVLPSAHGGAADRGVRAGAAPVLGREDGRPAR